MWDLGFVVDWRFRIGDRQSPVPNQQQLKDQRSKIDNLASYGLRPSGSTSSLALPTASTAGVPSSQRGIARLPSLYSDSSGAHTLSTRVLNRSPISRSVSVPRMSGYCRTMAPKLNPS